MHLHFEHCIHANSNASISTISWMGKVPDESPEEHGWKLNRVNYYQEGWLATGNAANVIGVTFTTSHCKRSSALPSRTNYNLRGHRSEVIFVKWNEPYQKLASCDSSGVIFVWFKYDGRWSIELINDRNTPVTHFSWSHEGRMALICYQDGFVLVGSVAGQRYWSSMLNLESTITTGVWSPDDQLVYLGTNNGQIIAMNLNGAMMGEFQLSYESGIISMTMFCENFKMEDDEQTNSNRQNQNVADRNKHNHLLAVSFQNGTIYLVKANDDVNPIKIENDFCGLPYVMEWSNSKQILAVAGVQSISRKKIESDRNGTTYGETVYRNVVKFFSETGTLLLQSTIPNKKYPVTAMAWGHNGKRLFIATGNEIHIGWVSRKVSSLQQLSRFVIYDLIEKESLLYQLPMPIRTRYTISKLFVPTIKCCVPENQKLREFVSRPPMPITNSTRLHCTMIKHFSSGDPVYGLYLEYLGSLFLILVGKKISKLKPEFLIFDTQTTMNKSNNENEYELRVNDSIFAKKSLPEELCLAHVTSNLWGTKFKIHGLLDSIPSKLGHIQYKASFLHLQPRQMTITVYEFRDELPNFPESSFNNNGTVNYDEYNDRQGNKRNTNLQQSNYSLKPMIAKVSTVSSNRNKTSEEPSKELCSSPSILVINPVIRSYSVGFLETSDMSTAGSSCSVPSKRLVLTQETQNKKSKNEIDIDDLLYTINENRRCNKSISLDIAELKAKKYHMNSEKDESKQIVNNDESMFDNETINLISKSTPVTPQLPKKRLNMRNFASTSSSIIKNSFLNSPFLNRKQRPKNPSVILEDFDAINEAEYDFADSTIDNEFNQKLIRNNESSTEDGFVDRQSFFRKSKKYKNYRVHLKDNEMPSKKVNVFEMQNKTPIWNETSQVYQLDFGGRVTQESAKNFQIEFQGKQVMQFGRIDENQFTLDYQHPFSALQAFSVALASITQRLK